MKKPQLFAWLLFRLPSSIVQSIHVIDSIPPRIQKNADRVHDHDALLIALGGRGGQTSTEGSWGASAMFSWEKDGWISVFECVFRVL